MESANYTIGVRLQRMGFKEQALILSRLAQARSQAGEFTPKQLEAMFEDGSLPKPGNTSDVIAKMGRQGLLTKGRQNGFWKITPLGRQTSIELLPDLDLAAFSAESLDSSSFLGQVAHTVVPPALAPPGLIPLLRPFLEAHPFETNVFGMTRFPDSGGSKIGDPISSALQIAREACQLHGLQFHLASDRAIHDDLWTNTAAHMWASQYGIGFFEDRVKEGLNYNLTIEIGSMLITGRRCALLKDRSLKDMPTDLVGKIYRSVDFGKPKTISDSLHAWMRDDLNLGRCSACPK